MTPDLPPTDIDRALAVIAACGADPARWPAEERAALLALATHPAVAAALAAARRLDDLLGDWATAPVASHCDAAAIAALPQAAPMLAPRRWLAGGAMAAAAAVALVLAMPARVDRSTDDSMASAASAVAATPGEDGDAGFAAVFTPTADEEDLI
ncbi:hypothetical protein IP88_01410 [alpha proteobacterium AAP81b]|nr:hypothetical protein IP88_01410 [alpha proteobacterium AAP81b]